MTADFYDDLAPLYHLVYADWDASIERQASQINAFMRAEWGSSVRRVLDAAAGIGTQALGLAALGYDVTASDISAKAVARAREEAASRGLTLRVGTADLRRLASVHEPHDLVLAWDNALPHLLTDDDVLLALRECYRCTTQGGGCLFSVRDYANESRKNPDMIPCGIRSTEHGRTAVFQVRDWDGDHYNVSFCFVEDLDGTPRVRKVEGGRYYAITIDRLLNLMQERRATIECAAWMNHSFQPALVGTRRE